MSLISKVALGEADEVLGEEIAGRTSAIDEGLSHVGWHMHGGGRTLDLCYKRQSYDLGESVIVVYRAPSNESFAVIA